MPATLDGEIVKFTSGRSLAPEAGSVGLTPKLELTEGYDSRITAQEKKEYFSKDDLVELADLMIARWTAFKAEIDRTAEADNIFQQEAQKHLAQWPEHPAVAQLLSDLRSGARDIDDAVSIINSAWAKLNTSLAAYAPDAPGPDHDAWDEGCAIMGQMRTVRAAFLKLPRA